MTDLPRQSNVDLKRELAARRCNADVEVWKAVHELHGSRSRVTVFPGVTAGRPVAGYIVAIDDLGFELDGGVCWAWPDVARVEPNQ